MKLLNIMDYYRFIRGQMRVFKTGFAAFFSPFLGGKRKGEIITILYYISGNIYSHLFSLSIFCKFTIKSEIISTFKLLFGTDCDFEVNFLVLCQYRAIFNIKKCPLLTQYYKIDLKIAITFLIRNIYIYYQNLFLCTFVRPKISD